MTDKELKATVDQLNEAVEKVMRQTKRGLLSAEEAGNRIDALIDGMLPINAAYDSPYMNWKAMEKRRLAKRREWRFLLESSKDATCYYG